MKSALAAAAIALTSLSSTAVQSFEITSIPNTSSKYLSYESFSSVIKKQISSRSWNLPSIRARIPASQSPNTRSFVRNQLDFVNCASHQEMFRKLGLPRFTGIESLAEYERMVESTLYYTTEGMTDTWRNMIGNVLTGTSAPADCDDIAITTAALAICGGADINRIGFVVYNARSYGPDNANHIAATYKMPDGRTVVFGDINSPTLWNAADRGLRPAFSARASNIKTWHVH